MNESDSLRVNAHTNNFSPAATTKKRREENGDDDVSKTEPSFPSCVPVVRSDAVLRLIVGSKRSWNTTATMRTVPKASTPLSDGVNDMLESSLRATSFITRLGSHNFARSCGNSSDAIASIGEGELTTALDALGPFAFCGESLTSENIRTTSLPISNPSTANSTKSTGHRYQKRSTIGDGKPPSSSSSSSIVILPPYEYCSVAMLNQARFGRNVCDTLTDKGGTVRNVLQSSKSFMHYLTTYPLKNTFRGYIQIRPYLLPHDIGLPAHHVTQMFGIDRYRDRALIAAWRPNYCASPICSATRRRCRNCPYWPDESFEYCFDTTRNFSLILKRDPCIHNGSIVAIRRVYVTYASNCDDDSDDDDRGGPSKKQKCSVRTLRNESVAGNDSIYVSSFILKNLNADFDGDTVTVMIVRGIESSCELEQCMMNEPLLYGAYPRFTFSQSLVYRLFRRLCFDDDFDETRAREHIARMTGMLRETRGSLDSLRAYVRRFLFDRLNLEDDGSLECINNKSAVAAAQKRARAIFGDHWYPYYARVSKRVLFVSDWHEKDLWSRALWHDAVLDATYVAAIRDGRADHINKSENLLEHLLQQARGVNDDSTSYFLGENILYLENWMIVHSGAKGSPLELWNLHERFVQVLGNELNAVESPQADFWRRCSRERANEYRRYLDDFVNVSKNVPKGSYFASGLKWVMQTCRVLDGNLVMGDRLLLSELAYYTQGIYGDFV